VLRTPTGIALLILTGVFLVLWLAQQVVQLPLALDLLRKIAGLAAIGLGGWALAVLLARNRRTLLWRVRRRLLLSYLFLGVVPIVLVLSFALAGAVVLYETLAAYLLRQGLDHVAAEMRTIADVSAAEVGRAPAAAAQAIADHFEDWSAPYPNLSLAVVQVPGAAAPGMRRSDAVLTAGAWALAPPPREAPDWLVQAGGFTGVVLLAGGDADAGAARLAIRASALTSDGRRAVVVDLPLEPPVVERIEARTGVRVIGASILPASPAASEGARSRPFEETVAQMEAVDWSTNERTQVRVRIEAPAGRLAQRIAAAQPASPQNTLVIFLVVLAVLFAIVQGSAVVMGGALVRSITHAVHELFVGTERVREGDFSHRIHVDSRDQLGDLADSFNRMSGSIERLLHVQREKQRLDDELRIAREIQRSLLPVRPPALAGVSIADLCEPAREVGGDYYDFFELGDRQLGVLIADVSGKGTSAALYMAELKGLMLALSHTERSPRRLLSRVNHLLAEHLDNRSFVTATYVVIDLERMTLTCARAGHTPLIVVSGGRSEFVVPGGMVLGLRLPGASERFETLLEEHTRRIGPGDLIVLYTDGITEAMDVSGELFGDETLARVLNGPRGLDPAAIRERVVREVRAFVGEADPHDDMTMVVIRIDEVEAR
jgi:sigma-B regulation protein RsbU (phosphoserine phosphatase)